MSNVQHTTSASHAWQAVPHALHRTALVGVAVAALAVTVVVGLATATWIGAVFPGFFLLPNRVVPSVSRDGWAASRDGAIFQRTVVAVAGRSVESRAAAYGAASALPAGSAIEYTLRHGSTVERLALESRVFTATDYWIVFGSYLATGLLYLWVGVLAAWFLPNAGLGRALLLVGSTGGVYALTGAALYDGGAGWRLHALAEAFFPATLVSLALAFGAPRYRFAAALGSCAWWISLALALPYQVLLGQPDAYSAVHGACEIYLGLAGLAVGATLLVERTRAAEQATPLLRASLAGALVGIGVPAVIMMVSGLSGGAVPVNVVTITAFCFPLGIGYGLLRGADQPSHAAAFA